MPNIETWIPLARRLADAAGDIARSYYRTPVAVETKADATPVSLADRRIESALRDILRAEVPEHAILGEEEGGSLAEAMKGFAWVIDPIDGTRAFLAGVPTFGTLIALCWQGVPLLGVLDQPILRERWVGANGVATLNGAPIHARACASLAEATFSTSSPFLFPPETQPGIRRLHEACRNTVFGKDCLAYGLLAAGHIDVVVEAGLKAHDVMALVPIVQGADGFMTQLNGDALTLEACDTVLACGDARLANPVRAILSSVVPA